MSKIEHLLVEDALGTGIATVTAFDPTSSQPIKQADSRHPHFKRIVEGLNNGDRSVFDLFDVQGGVVKQLTAVSDRITFDGSNILFDGDPQVGPLADHLLRCLEAGVENYEPVAKFWEKVATNPDDRSREQLFTWLQSHQFTITEDGDILGYKGVHPTVSGFESAHAGTAFVDGVEFKNSRIPNNIGTVVTMPRSAVANDPNVACHYGLHVGDWSYASGFARVVLEVHVNPRDVVSIPRDSGARKMRCCRYRVVKTRDAASGTPIELPEDNSWKGDVGYKPE